MSQLTSNEIVMIAESAVDTVAQNIEAVTGNAANMAAVLAVWTAMSAIKLAPGAAYAAALSEGACARYEALCRQLYQDTQGVANLGPATVDKIGLIKPGDTMSIGPDGTLDVRQLVFALGYPVVTMTPKVATGRPANVSLSAPAVLLPGAIVTAYRVSVDGGEVQEVPATDNAAVFTFTPAGAAGTTVTLTVTATDSVGNVSLETVATAEVVNGYVVAPNIISPAEGADLYSTPISVVTSAFAVFGTDDTHASTDWKVTSDEAGNTVISEALASPDLLAHTFPAITVTQVAPRYLWARHNGQNIGPSEWGHITVNINPSRHGEILYDTSNNPAAVITGSYLSGGKYPWCIRGRYVWLAFALASKRGVNQTWGKSTTSSDTTNTTDITTIENPSTSWKLAANNTATDGSGSYVSSLSTEAHMDASFIYTQTVKTSKELTDAILAYNANMMAAKFCRSVVLKDLGAMDLPSIDALMRLYQTRDVVDALDPTASANTAKKLSAWGFGSANGAYLFSASEGSSSSAWCVHSSGNLNSYSKNNQFGCVPSLEIPA